MKGEEHRRLIQTDDGSSSVYNENLRETYHSTHGALRESRHVFIDAGLAQCSTFPVRVLEIGFGTGLNVLLAMAYAITNGREVNMISLESAPLEEEIIRGLNHAQSMREEQAGSWFSWIHEQPWNEQSTYDQFFTLEKRRADWLQFTTVGDRYDVVFYDAFAPSRQPEMWTFSCIEKACTSLKSGGIFVTYSARGQLKRDLRALDMEVESIPGPPGKKEMVRAVKRA